MFTFERYEIKTGRDMAESKFAADLTTAIDPDWLSPVRREITDNLSGLSFSLTSRRKPSEPVSVNISPLRPAYPLAPGMDDTECMRNLLRELASHADPQSPREFAMSYENGLCTKTAVCT